MSEGLSPVGDGAHAHNGAMPALGPFLGGRAIQNREEFLHRLMELRALGDEDDLSDTMFVGGGGGGGGGGGVSGGGGGGGNAAHVSAAVVVRQLELVDEIAASLNRPSLRYG